MPAVSSAPVITSIIAIDGYSVQVTWRAPIMANGIITHYTITFNNGVLNSTVNVPFNGQTVSTYKTFTYMQMYVYVFRLSLSTLPDYLHIN